MSQPEQYDSSGYCGLCQENTMITWYSSGHERDRSHDWRRCHQCGGTWRGLTGEWAMEFSNAVPAIIPSIMPLDRVSSLQLLPTIKQTAGYNHNIILACGPGSAAENRNKGLASVAGTELVVMLDDDIMPINPGWMRILIHALQRPEVVFVSSQLYKADLMNYAYMTGLDDWGGVPRGHGETVVPTKRLLTACCAFKPTGCRFDEGYVGSGFEDVDFCNQLAAARPDGLFLICHDSHVVHYNEQREQRGEIWEQNKALYESKWGPVETREQLKRKYK